MDNLDGAELAVVLEVVLQRFRVLVVLQVPEVGQLLRRQQAGGNLTCHMRHNSRSLHRSDVGGHARDDIELKEEEGGREPRRFRRGAGPRFQGLPLLSSLGKKKKKKIARSDLTTSLEFLKTRWHSYQPGKGPRPAVASACSGSKRRRLAATRRPFFSARPSLRSMTPSFATFHRATESRRYRDSDSFDARGGTATASSLSSPGLRWKDHRGSTSSAAWKRITPRKALLVCLVCVVALTLVPGRRIRGEISTASKLGERRGGTDEDDKALAADDDTLT